MSIENQARQNLPGAFMIGILGWAVPGIGYIFKGRILRGVIVGGRIVNDRGQRLEVRGQSNVSSGLWPLTSALCINGYLPLRRS